MGAIREERDGLTGWGLIVACLLVEIQRLDKRCGVLSVETRFPPRNFLWLEHL